MTGGVSVTGLRTREIVDKETDMGFRYRSPALTLPGIVETNQAGTHSDFHPNHLSHLSGDSVFWGPE